MNDDDSSPLFELIPPDEMSPEQRAFRRNPESNLPLYRLLREPTDLNEFDWEKDDSILIWRDNQTILCLSIAMNMVHYRCRPFQEKSASFIIHGGNKHLFLLGWIYGKSDAAIAGTAAFFWSLKQSGGYIVSLRIGTVKDPHRECDNFDLCALEPDQLAHILDANPTRNYYVESGALSAEQSVILASRPYPLHLTLGASRLGRDNCFRFSDGGTAFLDALEKREFCFGQFATEFQMEKESVLPFSRANINRLFTLTNMFEKLVVEGLLDEENVMLPFSAPVNALSYHIHAKNLQWADVDSLDIVAQDIDFRFYMKSVKDWDTFLVSFLNRVAVLGHFKALSFAFADIIDEERSVEFAESLDKVNRVAKALIRVIRCNPQLSLLDLSSSSCDVKWDPLIRCMFKAMEDHEGLRIFMIKKYPSEDPDFLWLEKLLSRNHKINVFHSESDVPKIEKLYALNKFYCKSEELKKECSTVRTFLVAMAMMERNLSKNFQRRALFLSHHTDILYELIQDESGLAVDHGGPT